MIKTSFTATTTLVLVSIILLSSATAFVRPLNHRVSKNINISTTGLKSVSNWFSGVSGIPPSQILEETTLKLLVGKTSLDNVELECAYKASRDGWSAVDFHRCMDGRGSGLVVALSRSGATLGGFNPSGWMSTDDYVSSNAAFLWFQKGGSNIVKCPILSGGNAAIFDYATGGPCFGAADFVLGSPQAAVMGGFAGPDMMNTSINAGNLKEGSSSLGGAYEFVTGWPVRGKFPLSEVEIYCNSNVRSNNNNKQGDKWWPF